MGRIHYIDRLKALAMVAVIAGHLLLMVFHGNEWVVDGFFRFLFAWHVDLFFFLSGMLVKHPSQLRKTLLGVKRLLWPFVVVGLLYSIVSGQGVADFFLALGKHGYWFLFVLAQCRLLSLCFFSEDYGLGRYSIVADIAIALALFLGINVLLKVLPPAIGLGLLSVNMLYGSFPFFAIGLVVGKYCLQHLVFARLLPLWGLLALLYALLPPTGNPVVEHLGHLVLVMLFSGLFYLRRSKTSAVEQQMQRLGASTLDIYIYHYFIMLPFIACEAYRWLDQSASPLLYDVSASVLAVVVAWFSMSIGHLLRKSRMVERIIYG